MPFSVASNCTAGTETGLLASRRTKARAVLAWLQENLLGSAQVPVDEALRAAEDDGALGGCDLTLAEGIAKLVQVQDVVAISTGRYQEVKVEVMDDKSSLGDVDLDTTDPCGGGPG